MIKLKLREGLTRDLVDLWMLPGRAFRLASAGPIGVNPDQRMHEDTRRLTELSADLGIGLLQAAILLVTFVSVLWALSADFAFHVAGRVVPIPGYMVWAGVLYAGSASLLSYWVGRNLIGRNAERYAREADLRFSLVRVNEHIDAISLAAGEAEEARRIKLNLAAVLAAMRGLVIGHTNLTWVTAGYGWLTIVAPILVAAPLYFSGSLTFGGLMMAAGAFIQVQSSLAVVRRQLRHDRGLARDAVARRKLPPCHAHVRRIARRLGPHRLRGRVARCDDAREPGDRLAGGMHDARRAESRSEGRRARPGGGGTRSRQDPAVSSARGSVALGRGPHRPAERRDRLLHAAPAVLAPRHSARGPGLSAERGNFEAHAFTDALERVGLPRLAPMLDRASRWDLELNWDEQQNLMLARLLIHRPRWVVLDEVLDAIDGETRTRALEIFSRDLKDAAIIHIGRGNAADPSFTHFLHLIKDPKIRRLVREKPAETTGLPPGMQVTAAT